MSGVARSQGGLASRPLAVAGAAAVGVGIIAGLAGWLAMTSLQQDFAAYYTAGAARARGLDPYLNHLAMPGAPWDGISIYRHSRFLYPPLVADLFRPLAALPFLWAKVIFTGASVMALLVGLGLVRRDDGIRGDNFPWHTAVAAFGPLGAAIWPPVFLALERGQIDLLLLPLLAAAWRWRDRTLVAGPLLAGAAMGKPLLIGILPILACAGRWRWVATTVGALALIGAANVALSGRGLSQEYLRQVLPRAALYGEGGPETLLLGDDVLAGVADDLAAGVARIDRGGRVYAQQVGAFRRSASLPRLLACDNAPSVGVCLIVYLALGALLVKSALRSPDSAAWYWGAHVAAVVASPVSWAMSLVWALPVVSLGFTDKRPTPALLTLLVSIFTVALAAGALGPLAPLAWVTTGLATVAAAAMVTARRPGVG